MKLRLLAFFLFFSAPLYAAPPTEVPRGATPKEVELGDKAAAEIAKDPKIKILDPKSSPTAKLLVEKLNSMAEELGKVSARPDIAYKVTVISDDDVNAFTLPNGHIYVYQGLLDATASDDEVAGVLAHEIGHNACLHALRGQAKAKKLGWVSLATMLMALAGGSSGADLMQFSNYLLTGIMNGYGIEYEKEADAAGLKEMEKTPYNPSAMVTMMRRLELEEQRRPEIRLGIFQTHPPSEERATALLAQMEAAGLEFNPRAVEGAKRAKVEAKTDRFALVLNSVTILELAKTPDAEKRAQNAADALNALLRDNLQPHELSVSQEGTLRGRGLPICAATPADAALQKLSPLQSAQKWAENVRRLFWREQYNGKM